MTDIQTIVASIPTPLFAAGGGALMGYLIGKAVKLIFKIAAVIAGGIVLLLLYLQTTGIIALNYNKLQSVMYAQASGAFNSTVAIVNQAAKSFGSNGTEHIAAGTMGFFGGFIYAVRK